MVSEGSLRKTFGPAGRDCGLATLPASAIQQQWYPRVVSKDFSQRRERETTIVREPLETLACRLEAGVGIEHR